MAVLSNYLLNMLLEALIGAYVAILLNMGAIHDGSIKIGALERLDSSIVLLHNEIQDELKDQYRALDRKKNK